MKVGVVQVQRPERVVERDWGMRGEAAEVGQQGPRGVQ